MPRLTRMADRLDGLRRILADPRRKPLNRIAREAFDVARRSGEYPWYYFLNFAYREDAGTYTDYLYAGQYRALFERLRASEDFALLEDKLRFDERYRGGGFPLPHLLAHNEGTSFRVGGAERQVDDLGAFVALVDELRSRSGSGSVFVKPVNGRKGEDCRRIGAPGADLAALHAETRSRPFLFQETLVQHPALDAIYPESVNTIRVLTCRRAGEPAAVVAAILRLGVGGSVVDNASRGGIFVGIDLETGRLLPLARRFFKLGGDAHATHPDTGFRFEGFELPHFRDALAVAGRAAALLQHAVVGWDLAVTRAGVVLIEGNPVPHLPLVEVALGRGLMGYPSFRQLYEGMGLPR